MTSEQAPDDRPQPSILAEDRNCWRIARADRAAMLVDGAAYFPAVRQAMLNARETIFIIGWDVDSRVDLLPDVAIPEDGAPKTLGGLLQHLGRTRPEVAIHILLWDYAMVFALERELLPAVKLGWSTPSQVKLCLDDALPLGASQHQKVVVVDDAVAFCGGLDLTIRRWDSPPHEPNNSARVDPDGAPYGPFHDIQMVVDGEAARCLGELARERWLNAMDRPAPKLSPRGDPWPAGVEADFTDIRIGIARTLPETLDNGARHEVEALYRDMIAVAERFIYAENQYLTADSVTAALIERMQARPDLVAVFVCPEAPGGWFESRSMGIGRAYLIKRLQEAGVLDRVRIVHPWIETDGGAVEDGVSVMVHAKVMIVDDRMLRVGSSNLNNRSMGLDSECDLLIEAESEDTARAITAIRHRLMGEHLGLAPDAVGAAQEKAGSLLQLVDASADRPRGLRPVRHDRFEADEFPRAIMSIADPREPLPGSEFAAEATRNGDSATSWRRPLLALAALALIAAAALLWNFTPLAEWLEPKRVAGWLDSWSGSAWSFALLPLAYVGGSLVIFPITLLIAATALAFGPWSGFLLAAGGSLLAAAATYLVGAWMGRRFLRRGMGPRLNRISRALGEKGVIAVVTLRTAPIAPFTVVNLVCGASHVGFRDYMLGTAIGMAPGIIAMTAMGSSLRSVLLDPSGANWLVVGGAILGWIALGIGAQVAVSRLRRRKPQS